MRVRLVIIRVFLQALRYKSANSAVLLISSSLSSIDLMASFSTDTYYKEALLIYLQVTTANTN